MGSRNDYLTVTISNEKVRIGCFIGSLDELEAAARVKGRQDYLDLLPGIRAIVARRRGEGIPGHNHDNHENTVGGRP